MAVVDRVGANEGCPGRAWRRNDGRPQGPRGGEGERTDLLESSRQRITESYSARHSSIGRRRYLVGQRVSNRSVVM